MMNMYDGYNLFANTTFAVTAASLAVIRDRILSCEWNAEKLYGTLTFWDREVPTIFHASDEGKKLKSSISLANFDSFLMSSLAF